MGLQRPLAHRMVPVVEEEVEDLLDPAPPGLGAATLPCFSTLNTTSLSSAWLNSSISTL